MGALNNSGLLPAIERKVAAGTPILGICVGMQMPARRSEEGALPGLGWLEADVVRFRFEAPANNLRIPHMGWNEVAARRAHPLTDGIADPTEPARYCFAHPYYMVCEREEDVLLTCEYGNRFVACCAKGHIYGVQFRPEKSHKFGLRLLGNFAGRGEEAANATEPARASEREHGTVAAVAESGG